MAPLAAAPWAPRRPRGALLLLLMVLAEAGTSRAAPADRSAIVAPPPSPAPRIVGGLAIDRLEAPWMCLLRIGSRICGCSWVSRGTGQGGSATPVALTAAHCVMAEETGEPEPNISVYAVDRRDKRLSQIGVVLGEDVRIHASWYAPQLRGDVAVLAVRVFDSPAARLLKAGIGKVSLPSESDAFPAPGTRLSVWGFGDTSPRLPKERTTAKSAVFFSKDLRRVELPIVSNEDCVANLRSVEPNWRPLPGQFCAGGAEGRDACGGDSGGPALLPGTEGPEGPLQWGIISFGWGCGTGGIPAVYQNLGWSSAWVKETVLDIQSAEVALPVPVGIVPDSFGPPANDHLSMAISATATNGISTAASVAAVLAAAAAVAAPRG